MAITDDIQAKLVQISKDIVAERTEVQGKLKTLSDQVTTIQAQVAQLQSQLAAGTVISNSDLAAVSSALDLIDTNVKTISDPIPTGTA